jgi:ABC-type bacteriocin/lantibiotic exporter with double-glycine peptidase domain
LFIIETKKEDYSDIDIKGDITIKDISYSINNKKILDNINLNINYKDKVFIYGKSGIGKSTLLKIILKYLGDYEGEVYINNINIKDINSEIILSNFTYVSQNSYLNNDTLKNNIIYDRNIDEKDYEEIIHLCNLDSLRDSKMERNNFMIEDNGFNISGGEKQKVILARSLLKNSNYIILDEALSEVSLDEEKEIISRILLKYKDKTIVYISHKEDVYSLFDKKYFIERSK